MSDRSPPVIALIGPPSIAVEGLLAVLAGAPAGVPACFDNLAAFARAGSGTPEALCVVVGLGQATWVAREIKALKLRRDGLRIVTVSVSRDEAALFRAAGVDAHLSLDAVPRALIEALATSGSPQGAAGSAGQVGGALGAPGSGPALSSRELEVIAGLTEGLSNKLLARRLLIAEATVKAHIRTILRKTGAANRTQIAIWNAQDRPVAGMPGPGPGRRGAPRRGAPLCVPAPSR